MKVSKRTVGMRIHVGKMASRRASMLWKSCLWDSGNWNTAHVQWSKRSDPGRCCDPARSNTLTWPALVSAVDGVKPWCGNV